MSAYGEQGRAGSGPAGPAGVPPYRFTDEARTCMCTVCGECICFSVHTTAICACCRADLHNGSCGDQPAWPGTTSPAPTIEQGQAAK